MTRRFVDLGAAAGRDRLRPAGASAGDRLLRPPADRRGGGVVLPGSTVDDLPDGEGWAIERVRITTHNGTHLGAFYPLRLHDGRW